jgi:hypothetical protein
MDAQSATRLGGLVTSAHCVARAARALHMRSIQVAALCIYKAFTLQGVTRRAVTISPDILRTQNTPQKCYLFLVNMCDRAKMWALNVHRAAE